MNLADNFTVVRKTIPLHVNLIAVSKTVEEQRLRAALDAGQREFGENYVQEAKAKWPPLRPAYPDLRLHLIGHLQSNKTDDAVALFDAIDTLDRPKLARALAASMKKLNRNLPLLIEVNIGGETQKSGCLPQDVPELLRLAHDTLKLDVRGLMCIPPANKDPAPFFRELVRLADELDLPVRSMGMSADYETAIACGATEVRVGSALFGARG